MRGPVAGGAAGLLVVVLCVPAAWAQVPVPACRAQCEPAAPDVNGPGAARVGPVRVLLYGHGHRDSGQALPANQALLTTERPADIGDADRSYGARLPFVGAPRRPEGELVYDAFLSSRPAADATRDIFSTTAGWAGPAADLRLAGAEVVAYIYLSAAGPDPAPVPAALPQVQMFSRLVPSRMAAGDPLYDGVTWAWGRSNAATLLPMPGLPPVHEFRIPMRLNSELIPQDASEGGLRWQVFLTEFEPGSTVLPLWRVHTGPTFPPRLVLTMPEPVRVLSVAANAHAADHFVRAAFESPLGAYDIDAGSVRVEAAGPSPLPERAFERKFLGRVASHDEPQGELRATWRVDFEGAGAAPGRYVLRVFARNLQGTYEAHGEATYDYAVLEGVDAIPGPGVALLLGALAALAAALRPRGRRR